MNYYMEEMMRLKADGIDFMPIFSEKIIASYTKEEFKNVTFIPKTNYKFWKMKKGKKEYIK